MVLIVFSHNGSIKVNKSRLFAFRCVTSAPPALPNMISPAFLDASIATRSTSSNNNSDGTVSLLLLLLSMSLSFCFVVDDASKCVCIAGILLKNQGEEETAVLVTVEQLGITL